MNCRHCSASLELRFLDLGNAPPSNAYLSSEDLDKPEKTFPLRVLVCTQCWLVQTEDFVGADDLFRPDYAYFSSTSSSWLAHAKKYCDAIIPQLGLSTGSFVVEIASNDGYLLKNFLSAGIPCLGIEPTASTAAAAEKLGIPVLRKFFGKRVSEELVKKGPQADLIIGNNVYAHVPEINDFTQGMAALLKPEGVITLEFPHLLKLVEQTLFDTVYHEHFSYLSLHAARTIFQAAGLKIWDVEELSSHGGSLRVYGCLQSSVRPTSRRVAEILKKEQKGGLLRQETYFGFQARVEKIKEDLLNFLKDCQKMGKKVVGYGAAAKGNTLLNYAGVKADLLPYVCDAAPSKQGKYLPGSRIPIRSPSILTQASPEKILILPWNLAEEIVGSLKDVGLTRARFVTAIPFLSTA